MLDEMSPDDDASNCSTGGAVSLFQTRCEACESMLSACPGRTLPFSEISTQATDVLCRWWPTAAVMQYQVLLPLATYTQGIRTL